MIIRPFAGSSSANVGCSQAFRRSRPTRVVRHRFLFFSTLERPVCIYLDLISKCGSARIYKSETSRGTMLENPFRKGQVVECRSFIKGYRGAWFRCKILEIISGQRGDICRLEYLDYKDKPYHTKLYQYVPKTNKSKKQIMLRPEFPPVVRHYDPATSRHLMAVITRDWEAGDFVEWLSKGCYWECQILKVLSKQQVEVVCPEPPFGQGGTYPVFKKLLRPALEWSPELGWGVKLSKIQKAVPCVSLVLNAQSVHSQPIQGGDVVVEIAEDPELDSSICDDHSEKSQSFEGRGHPTGGSDQHSGSAVSDSISQPRRKRARRLKNDCSDDELGVCQSLPSAENDFSIPLETKSRRTLKPSSSVLGDENQLAQDENKIQQATPEMLDGFVAESVDRNVKYLLSRKIVRQAKLYLLAKEANCFPRLHHTRKKDLRVPGEKNEKMGNTATTSTPLEECNEQSGHGRMKSADSDKSCEIIGGAISGFKEVTSTEVLEDGNYIATISLEEWNAGHERTKSVDSDKSCEIIGGATLGHDEEVACTKVLADVDGDCADLMTVAFAAEELTQRVVFLKDVLKHGVKACLQLRSQSKWEIKQAIGNKLTLT